MDTFDGSKPNLISSKVIKDIESKLDCPTSDDGNKVINGIGYFYHNYISPNMFPIIIISVLILYLTIKYVLKRDREEKEEFSEKKKKKKNKNKKNTAHNVTKTIVDNQLDFGADGNNDPDISDIISDDYLLTDDNDVIENNNTDIENNENMDDYYRDQNERY
jgi:large-conductance mechanosensitive channel